MNPNLRGFGLIPRSICERCRNHYPFGSEGWKKHPENACRELKERLKREAGILPIGDKHE